MLRRSILSIFALILGCVNVIAAADRPNILWVTSEDNSFHWLGCYGDEQAETPNLDKLAGEGILYKYAYANAPVCAVARCTLITGAYACSLGTQNMRSRYPIPKKYKPYVSHLRKAGYYCVNRSKTDYNFKGDDKSYWDECSGKAHWKNRAEGQPFFAIFNSGISHESSLFAKKTEGYRRDGLIPEKPSRDPASVALPPFLPDTPEIRQDWVTYMDIVTAMDNQIGQWLDELEEAGLKEDTIIIYYSDHGGILPRAKRYIYDTGTHVPMIARIPKKWSHLADDKAGTASDRPVSFIDLPATALALAGVKVPQRFEGTPFLGEKRKPAEPYAFLFGQRFDSRMLRFVRAVTDGKFRYIRNFNPHRHRGILAGYPHGQVGWQSFYELHQKGETTAEQRSFWAVPQPVDELYDLENDPWEVNNLAGDPRYATQLTNMRKATLDKMLELRDTGLVPESMYNVISKSGTVREYVQSKEFPYEAIMLTAINACNGHAELLPSLKEAMQHEHQVMRYWGALGCTIRGEKANGCREQLLELLEDSSEAVRVAAAEALVRIGDKSQGLKALTEILATTEDDMVALDALNIVAALGLTSEISKETYVRACNTGSYPKRMLEDYPK